MRRTARRKKRAPQGSSLSLFQRDAVVDSERTSFKSAWGERERGGYAPLAFNKTTSQNKKDTLLGVFFDSMPLAGQGKRCYNLIAINLEKSERI